MKENEEIKREARQALSGNWGYPVLIHFLHFLIMQFVGSFPLIGTIFVGGPLNLGLAKISFDILDKNKVDVEVLFSGFNHFGEAVKAQLYILLWMFLGVIIAPFTLFIPLVMWALSYSMTFFILAENPEMDGFDAARKSKEMMDGHKARLFALFLRFILWIILVIVTFGLGAIVAGPYMQAAAANFYRELKKEHGDTIQDVDPEVLDAELS